ncbi:BTB/POZ domain-containing protein 18 [Podarcis raffonei]|uniref:BTB/POZ domain-containing protein 18 n=1 Tax=Podarcis raffonei TaxID=65483 RepID=UPI0023297050|nr:BTB/POZ domain-containing protein 18 [Podarcis raffonei]XP_053254055.1 BTB/POZ domain-containing protein 18 [Podarcis raffonei]XP_053254064.1 BTB/POZ domain-containing protein 18 [Podarcis raffonei]
MSPPAANPKILYRNSRLLRMVFLQLHRQQRADLFCDVVLQAEGEAVPAHCCILSACSPFFTERLEREMPPKGHKVVLEIRGLKIGTLRKLVDFLYTSEMEVSREEAQDVLAAARQLQVSELESLHLEGGKLVKKSLGPRLNRDCLQLSSPLSIPELTLFQSPPACSGSSLTSWLSSNMQHTVVKVPCTKEMDNNSSIVQKAVKKEKPEALMSRNEDQMPKDPAVTAEPLRTKVKKRLTGMGKNILGNNEHDSLRTQDGTGDSQATTSLQESKKIKLSRSKLPSSPLPVPCAIKDSSTVESSKPSRSSRRHWRQKSLPIKDEQKEAEDSHLYGFWSPPLPPEAAKSRKCNASEPCVSCPQNAGQIGRVRLRKVINGSCWEVVQESPSAQATRPANSMCPLKEEGSRSPPRYPEPEGVDAQQSVTSTRCLPTKIQSPPLNEKNLGEQAENKVSLEDGDPYKLDLFLLDHLTEDVQYDKLVSAGELEHMLDMFLADDGDAVEEPQEATIPEGMNILWPAPGANECPLECAEVERKDMCSPEVSDCPPWVKTKNSLLRGELEAIDMKISREAHGSANGRPLLDPVPSYFQFGKSETSSDCFTWYKPASPQLDDWTAQHQLSLSENMPANLGDPLPITLADNEDRGFLSYEVGICGVETQLHAQTLQKSPLQHHLGYKVPPCLEEEEIDVGGVDELLVSIECVRPDPSPVSETEVDVVN